METDVRYYSARELAEAVGCTRKALRVYQAKGLIAPVRTTGNRRYSADAFERLRFIVSLRNVGLPVDDIGALLAAREQVGDQASEAAQALAEQLGVLIPRITERIRQLLLTRNELVEARETLQACARCAQSIDKCPECAEAGALDPTSALLLASRQPQH